MLGKRLFIILLIIIISSVLLNLYLLNLTNNTTKELNNRRIDFESLNAENRNLQYQLDLISGNSDSEVKKEDTDSNMQILTYDINWIDSSIFYGLVNVYKTNTLGNYQNVDGIRNDYYIILEFSIDDKRVGGAAQKSDFQKYVKFRNKNKVVESISQSYLYTNPQEVTNFYLSYPVVSYSEVPVLVLTTNEKVYNIKLDYEKSDTTNGEFAVKDNLTKMVIE